jgi:hypothetical protein
MAHGITVIASEPCIDRHFGLARGLRIVKRIPKYDFSARLTTFTHIAARTGTNMVNASLRSNSERSYGVVSKNGTIWLNVMRLEARSLFDRRAQSFGKMKMPGIWKIPNPKIQCF